MARKKLVIFGDSAFAEVAYELFTKDSDYEVAGFTVSREFQKQDRLLGLDVVPFESLEDYFSPRDYSISIALVYNSLNRVRRKFYVEAKEKGYDLASYISSKASVWDNVEVGDNCFIFENNVIQPFVKIGSNNVFWSGNHIGHHTKVGSHNFVASHVVVSGFCEIGSNSFFGVNATIGNNLKIGDDCLIGQGANIVKSLDSGSMVKGAADWPEQLSTWKKFDIEPPGF